MHIQEWRKSTTRYKTIKKQHSNTHTQTESVSDTHKHGELIYTKEQVAHTQLTIQQPSLNTRLICNNSWIIVWQPKGRRWYTEVRRGGGGGWMNYAISKRPNIFRVWGNWMCSVRRENVAAIVKWFTLCEEIRWNRIVCGEYEHYGKSRFFRSVFFCSKQISVCLTNST